MSNECCCSCGKNLKVVKVGKGTEYAPEINLMIAGMVLNLSWEGTSPDVAEAIKLNLGKYAPHDPSITAINFKFCFECLIKALMHTSEKEFHDKMSNLWPEE